MEIVLATSNPHKVEELSAIFQAVGLAGVTLLTLAQASPSTLPRARRDGHDLRSQRDDQGA